MFQRYSQALAAIVPDGVTDRVEQGLDDGDRPATHPLQRFQRRVNQ